MNVKTNSKNFHISCVIFKKNQRTFLDLWFLDQTRCNICPENCYSVLNFTSYLLCCPISLCPIVTLATNLDIVKLALLFSGRIFGYTVELPWANCKRVLPLTYLFRIYFRNFPQRSTPGLRSNFRMKLAQLSKKRIYPKIAKLCVIPLRGTSTWASRELFTSVELNVSLS